MKKICKRCDKQIKKNEKGVTWITFEGEKELEKIHWHWQCFLDWRNESIENRAKKIYADTMKKIMPMAKQMVGNVLNEEEIKSNLYQVGVG